MRQKQYQKIIVVVGPTASGKSELGIRIAKKLNGEIVSADSRQVYRGLDIGSGKVRGRWAEIKDQKLKTENKSRCLVYKGIRHHCLDVADPKKVFTAADFVKCGRNAIANVLSRSKTPIIVGGTGFYIDALLGKIPLAPVPPNPMLRKKLEKKTAAQLFVILRKLDPARANTIDKNNPRRLIRAIEIVSSSKYPPHASTKGDSLGWQKQKSKTKINPTSRPQSPTIHWLGIKRSPENLKRRIRKRLTVRLPGIIREVKKLHRQGISWKRMDELGLEYRFVSRYIHAISEVRPPKTKNVRRWRLDIYTTMIDELRTAIWHYARRQMTWWEKNKKIRWFSASEEALRYVRRTTKLKINDRTASSAVCGL